MEDEVVSAWAARASLLAEPPVEDGKLAPGARAAAPLAELEGPSVEEDKIFLALHSQERTNIANISNTWHGSTIRDFEFSV